MPATDGRRKAIGISGCLTAALYLAAFALLPTGAPDSAASGEELVAFVSEHRTRLLAAYLMLAAGIAVLMFFVAGLYWLIGRAEGEDGWLAMASVTTAVIGAGIFTVGTAMFMVVAYRPSTDPAVARAFWDAGWLTWNIASFGFVAWIAVITVATLRDGTLPRWSAWVGIPVGVVNLVGPFAIQGGSGPFSPQGWYAMVVGLTFAVWLLVIAIVSGRTTARTAEYP